MRIGSSEPLPSKWTVFCFPWGKKAGLFGVQERQPPSWRCLCSRQKSAAAPSSPHAPLKPVPSGTTRSVVAVGAFLCWPISPECHFWVEKARICVCRGVGGRGVSPHAVQRLWGHHGREGLGQGRE